VLEKSQAWNAIGTAEIDVDVDFHGLRLADGREKLNLVAGNGLSQLPISKSIRTEIFKPQFSFGTFWSV
jgi:hypothetical protein